MPCKQSRQESIATPAPMARCTLPRGSCMGPQELPPLLPARGSAAARLPSAAKSGTFQPAQSVVAADSAPGRSREPGSGFCLSKLSALAAVLWRFAALSKSKSSCASQPPGAALPAAFDAPSSRVPKLTRAGSARAAMGRQGDTGACAC